MQYNGIDVSEIQGNINWKNVELAGIKFAMIRASYGSSGVDLQFEQNMQDIAETAVAPGAYHESQAQSVNEALAEAKHFVNTVRRYKFSYPLALHISSEIAFQMGKEFFTEIVAAFLNFIKSSNYYPMLYADINMINEYVDPSKIPNIDIWLADWTKNVSMGPSYDKNVTIWQHSNRGEVRGINGNVNLDISYVDYPAIIMPQAMMNSSQNQMPSSVQNSSNGARMNSSQNQMPSSMQNSSNGARMNSAQNQMPSSMQNSSNGARMNSSQNQIPSSMQNSLNGARMNPGVINNFANSDSNNMEPDFSEPSFYTVEKGDTLRKIAEKALGNPEQYRKIMELNGLTRPIVFAGQTLRIPQNFNSGTISYRVNPGDTLWKISERFLGSGARYSEIMTLNALTSDMIYPGQILKIAVSETISPQTYVVKKGDTLWKIAQNMLGDGNRYKDIMSANNMTNGNLRVGQSLNMPSK